MIVSIYCLTSVIDKNLLYSILIKFRSITSVNLSIFNLIICVIFIILINYSKKIL